MENEQATRGLFKGIDKSDIRAAYGEPIATAFDNHISKIDRSYYFILFDSKKTTNSDFRVVGRWIIYSCMPGNSGEYEPFKTLKAANTRLQTYKEMGW